MCRGPSFPWEIFTLARVMVRLASVELLRWYVNHDSVRHVKLQMKKTNGHVFSQLQAGTITIKFDLIKNGVKSRCIKSPVFRPGDVAPNFGPGRFLTFEGFSVDEQGKQHFMDATVAYRQACLRAIEYLKQFGMSSTPPFASYCLTQAFSDCRIIYYRLFWRAALSPSIMRPDQGLHRRYCGYSQRVHYSGRAHGYFRL